MGVEMKVSRDTDKNESNSNHNNVSNQCTKCLHPSRRSLICNIFRD